MSDKNPYEGLMWCPQFHAYCLHTQQIERSIQQKMAQQLRSLYNTYYTDETGYAVNNFFVEFIKYVRELEGGKDE